MAILYAGIDLAKTVFALHGVDGAGKPALLKPSVRCAELVEMVTKLPPCVIAMEACSGAHHWARDHPRSATSCGRWRQSSRPLTA